MDFWETPITTLPGIGQARAKAFERLDIRTYRDLLLHYPRAYIDHRTPMKIFECAAHEDEYVTVRAIICAPPVSRRIRKGMTVTKVRIADESGAIAVTFFNNPYIQNMLRTGEEYRFYGKVGHVGATLTMTSPLFEPYIPEKMSAFRAIYPLTGGLTQRMVSTAVTRLLPLVPPDFDPLPETVRREMQLCSWQNALRYIHAPENEQQLSAARNRITFEKLFYYLLILGVLRTKSGKENRNKININDDSFVKLQSFTLTNPQQRVISEIHADLAGRHVMNRLLQGDVGSGKTLVAGDAAWQVIHLGYQAAMMAPTEILARQHYEYFAPLFARLGKKSVLLIGSMTAAQKKAVYAQIESGEADFIIGTHALIQKGVTFSDLALVITDEQHRFGVLQRSELGKKGADVHILAMSATPIPRTMALILYGDLDISVLDELPPGRKSVETFLVTSDYEQRLNRFLQKQLALGRQAYYVCPLIEDNEESELTAAEAQFDALQKLFPGRCALLHGKMKAAEKAKIMNDFASGNTKILVSTTVIEVGINVPNATLMIIKDAYRFGLSQLHQLRGRVGRGGDQSYCVLISDSKSKSAVQRLRFFCSTADGFKIAEQDLKTRGPGDLIGARQSGESAVAEIIAQNCDMRQVEQAKKQADRLLAQDPTLSAPENQMLKKTLMEKIESKGDIFN